jgi:AmmeMemoRadiSam system protein A
VTKRPAFRALNEDEQQFALKLARESMERFVRKGEVYDPVAEGLEIPAALRPHAGSFVTLKIDGELRGCIGDIIPVRPLYQSILKRAISSAAEDRRFEPVSRKELEKIHIEISVLTPPEKVDSWKQIEVGKHGILFSYDGRRRSVYLPQVATEQGWDLEETLIHLSQKGQLPGDAFMSPRASFEVFTAQVFGEDE